MGVKSGSKKRTMKKKPISNVNLTPYVRKSTHNSLGLSGEGSYDRSLRVTAATQVRVLLLFPLSQPAFFSGIIRTSTIDGMDGKASYVDVNRKDEYNVTYKVTGLSHNSTNQLKRAEYQGAFYAAWVGENASMELFKLLSATSSHAAVIVTIGAVYLLSDFT